MQNKNQSPFLVPGIVMMGMILRIPFTSIPPVISEVAKGLGVSVSSLGILTTIPLLSFAIVSPLAPKFGQKWGIEKSFAIFVYGSRIIITHYFDAIFVFRNSVDWRRYCNVECVAPQCRRCKFSNANWSLYINVFTSDDDCDYPGIILSRANCHSN